MKYNVPPSTSSPPVKPSHKFWRLNAFIVLAIICNLINLIYYSADGMMQSAAIELAGIAVLGICIVCNMKGYFALSGLLSVLIVISHSFLICYIQGIGGGAYLYLFPFVLAMIFL